MVRNFSAIAATIPPGIQPWGITDITPANRLSSSHSIPLPTLSTASLPHFDERYRLDLSSMSIMEGSLIDILDKSSLYLSSKCGSEAVLSVGSGIEWLEDSRFAGVISVMPHGCMPGGIVAAMAEKFRTMYQK